MRVPRLLLASLALAAVPVAVAWLGDPQPTSAMITVRWTDTTGRPTEPFNTASVEKTEEEWRAQLTPEQYKITRGKGTEAPFCGIFHDHKQPGLYTCIGCELPLFSADTKFDSGTGWPSFFAPFASENVKTKVDRSFGMVRKEILCARCDAHLGHVFDDGPRPTRQRYCLNSDSLRFVPTSDLAPVAARRPDAVNP